MPILGIVASSRLKAPSEPVAGYNLWLDADHAASFTYSSGTSVSQWTDRSANAYAFTQATGTLQPNRNGTQNGKTTVSFDADRLVSTAASSVWKYLHDGSTATVFIVCQDTTSSAGALPTAMSTQNNSTAEVGWIFYIYDRTSAESFTGRGVGGTGINAVATVTANSWNVFSTKLDQSNATTADKAKLYVGDGAANNSTGAYSPSSSNPLHTLIIGGVDGASYAWKGYIAEIIGYTSLLSETDRQTNVDYLQAKWGV